MPSPSINIANPKIISLWSDFILYVECYLNIHELMSFMIIIFISRAAVLAWLEISAWGHNLIDFLV